MEINYNTLEKEIKKSRPITDFVDLQKIKYNSDIFSEEIQCIYSFWFDNNGKIMNRLKRDFDLIGPGNKKESITWNWNLDESKICLYVGKTQNFKKRLSQHLLLKTENLYHKKRNMLNKKTTACQLRAGFDYLFQEEEIDLLDELAKRIYISYIQVDTFAERFYIEDYLIGIFKPWFNLDSER